ncbi:MAG: hypothetical protein ABIO70_12895 [Pseudomonadota bacterium]
MSTTPTRRAGPPWAGYANPPWCAKDKDKVTILFNFVERRKSFFLKAYFDRMGYRSEDLGDYVYEDVRWGKEYGNRMECNPMYFTIGSLLKNLFRIQRETGLSKAEIVERYVFVCGGGQCGPCRYGMYPQEYWKALHDAGFEGFRLLIFSSGFTAEDAHADTAFRFDTRFRINMVHALVLADLVHVAECALRPYAVDREAALAAIAEVELDLLTAFRQPSYARAVVKALRRASDRFAAIPRREGTLPRLYITGEIFANLAHNEGNYNLRRFIMDHGCEVSPGLFTQRVMYDFWRQQHIFLPAIRYARSLRGCSTACSPTCSPSSGAGSCSASGTATCGRCGPSASAATPRSWIWTTWPRWAATSTTPRSSAARATWRWPRRGTTPTRWTASSRPSPLAACPPRGSPTGSWPRCSPSAPICPSWPSRPAATTR